MNITPTSLYSGSRGDCSYLLKAASSFTLYVKTLKNTKLSILIYSLNELETDFGAFSIWEGGEINVSETSQVYLNIQPKDQTLRSDFHLTYQLDAKPTTHEDGYLIMGLGDVRK